MPLVETEAIVLRTYRLAEADKIVSLLTRQMGRVRAVAAGAQRPKSRYGGTLEPLSYVRLWLFERENRDLARLNSVELIESFFAMQTAYAAHVAAQYLAEVSERLLPEREVNDRVFRLMLAVLRGLKRGDGIDRPLVYFNYWFLRVAGFLPAFEHCHVCGASLGEAYYGAGSAGLVCTACRSALTPRHLPQSARVLAASLREASPDRWFARTEPPTLVRQLRQFLETLMEFHAERKLVTRDLLQESSDE